MKGKVGGEWNKILRANFQVNVTWFVAFFFGVLD